MYLISKCRALWKKFFRSRQMEQKLQKELDAYLEMLVEEKIEEGLSPAEARRRAAIESGGTEQVKESVREAWTGGWIDSSWRDICYGARTLSRNPGFTLVALLTLALAIGANTAIFSLIDTLLLRPLPVPEPERLVILSDPSAAGIWIGSDTGARQFFAYHEFEHLRDHNQVLSGITASQSSRSQLRIQIAGTEAQTERSFGRLVSSSYFSVLGVRPLLGRTFPVAEREEVNHPVAVVSYPYWNRRFGRDPSVVGRTFVLNETAFTIIGVMPRGFLGETVGEVPDMWLPLSMQSNVMAGEDFLRDSGNPRRTVMWLHLIGRLKSGVSHEEASAHLNGLFRQLLESRMPADLAESDAQELLDQRIELRSASHGASYLRAQFSEPLEILMAVVALILLIACANVANLLLARGAGRQREIGVRLALGASRLRVLRQLLAESLLLALAGGILAVFFALWARGALVGLVLGNLPSLQGFEIDLRLLAFTASISLATGLLFGLAPCYRALRADVSGSLHRGRGRSGARRQRLSKGLVASQVAMSLLVLVGAGLFLGTFLNLSDRELGYDRENLLLVWIDSAPAGYREEQRPSLYRQLADTLGAIAGVHRVSFSENGLFSGADSGLDISIEGFAPQSDGDENARFDQVGPGYFQTLGIPILLGRDLTWDDAPGSPPAAVVNETMARFYFGEDNPIGRRFTNRNSDSSPEYRIVGVAGDARGQSLRREVRRRFYVPAFQPVTEVPSSLFFIIRAQDDPVALVRVIRDEIRSIDTNLRLGAFRTVQDLADRTLGRERLIARLSAVFGLVALGLASIGLYGVISYSITSRTHEIGIRKAVGARRTDVGLMVLRETVLLVLAGIAIGLPVSLGASQLVSSFLFGLAGHDPRVITIAVVVLLAVALLAGLVPARRAARVEPLVALRSE